MGEGKQPRIALGKIHRTSMHNREMILKSSVCGCFYCEKTFEPKKIQDWTHRSHPLSEFGGEGQTALCPHCGIDSVIGDASGTTITTVLLKRMRKCYFW